MHVFAFTDSSPRKTWETYLQNTFQNWVFSHQPGHYCLRARPPSFLLWIFLAPWLISASPLAPVQPCLPRATRVVFYANYLRSHHSLLKPLRKSNRASSQSHLEWHQKSFCTLQGPILSGLGSNSVCLPPSSLITGPLPLLHLVFQRKVVCTEGSFPLSSAAPLPGTLEPFAGLWFVSN